MEAKKIKRNHIIKNISKDYFGYIKLIEKYFNKELLYFKYLSNSKKYIFL